MTGTAVFSKELFISRTGKDKEIAVVIAKMLRDTGYTTFLQDEDFGHTNFMARMREGFAKVEGGGRVVALLSQGYMQSDYCLVEADYPLTGDPSNKKQRLIILRIEECAPTAFLKSLPYVDLVPLLHDVEALARAVRGAVDPNAPEANYAALYRRAPMQILHPEIRAVPCFTGREDLLASIDAALWGKDGGTAALTNDATSAAVKGLGGVGKSVLAREYAWRARGRYHGVWWVRAETEQTLIDDLIDLGSRLIPNLKEVQERDRALHLALDAIAAAGGDKPWLIVYDNVEKPSAIARLTPKTSAHIPITSRWPRWRGHAQELPVDVFPEDVAVDFLLAERPREPRDAAGRLAAALGFLPLALSHARAYCAETNLSFDDYAPRLSELIQEMPEDAEYPASVFATFSLAIAKAAEACPEAEKLMEIAAFLAPERIPLDIITEDVMSEMQREKAVAALFKVSLITHDISNEAPQSVSLHRLIQAVFRSLIKEKSSEIAKRAVALIRAAQPQGFSSQDYGEWPRIDRLLPHALASLEMAPDKGVGAEDTAGLTNSIGRYFYQRGAYYHAESFYRRALEIREKVLGSSHSDVGASLGNLAWLYIDQCRYQEAEQLGQRSFEIAEKNHGEAHIDTGRRLHLLARLHCDLGDYQKAESLIKRSLMITEAVLGADHQETGWRLKHLADIYSRQGRYKEAEPLYRRAIDVVGIERDVTSGKILNNFANLYRAQFRNDDAERLYILALENTEKAFGSHHPSIGTYLNNLGVLYRIQHRYGEAEALHKRALKIAEDAVGPNHPSTV